MNCFSLTQLPIECISYPPNSKTKEFKFSKISSISEIESLSKDEEFIKSFLRSVKICSLKGRIIFTFLIESIRKEIKYLSLFFEFNPFITLNNTKLILSIFDSKILKNEWNEITNSYFRNCSKIFELKKKLLYFFLSSKKCDFSDFGLLLNYVRYFELEEWILNRFHESGNGFDFSLAFGDLYEDEEDLVEDSIDHNLLIAYCSNSSATINGFEWLSQYHLIPLTSDDYWFAVRTYVSNISFSPTKNRKLFNYLLNLTDTDDHEFVMLFVHLSSTSTFAFPKFYHIPSLRSLALTTVKQFKLSLAPETVSSSSEENLNVINCLKDICRFQYDVWSSRVTYVEDANKIIEQFCEVIDLIRQSKHSQQLKRAEILHEIIEKLSRGVGHLQSPLLLRALIKSEFLSRSSVQELNDHHYKSIYQNTILPQICRFSHYVRLYIPIFFDTLGCNPHSFDEKSSNSNNNNAKNISTSKSMNDLTNTNYSLAECIALNINLPDRESLTCLKLLMERGLKLNAVKGSSTTKTSTSIDRLLALADRCVDENPKRSRQRFKAFLINNFRPYYTPTSKSTFSRGRSSRRSSRNPSIERDETNRKNVIDNEAEGKAKDHQNKDE